MSRPIYEIAAEIRAAWPKPAPSAQPYLGAMLLIDKISDKFYQDSGRSVVGYFLANAHGWRGPDARRIKAELLEMLK